MLLEFQCPSEEPAITNSTANLAQTFSRQSAISITVAVVRNVSQLLGQAEEITDGRGQEVLYSAPMIPTLLPHIIQIQQLGMRPPVPGGIQILLQSQQQQKQQQQQQQQQQQGVMLPDHLLLLHPLPLFSSHPTVSSNHFPTCQSMQPSGQSRKCLVTLDLQELVNPWKSAEQPLYGMLSRPSSHSQKAMMSGKRHHGLVSTRDCAWLLYSVCICGW